MTFYIQTIMTTLMILVGVGCGQDIDFSPIHRDVLCTEAADDNTPGCESQAFRKALDEWLSEAIQLPSSTINFWKIGPDRSSYRHLFTAQVPLSWGPGVMEAKARFITTCRERITNCERLSGSERLFPENVGIPDINEVDQRLFLLGAKGRTQVMRRGEGEPMQTTLLCNQSASTMGSSCSVEDAVRAFGQWFSDSQLVPGSSFTIWVPGSSRDTASRAFRVAIPEGPLGERAAFVLSAGQELRQWGNTESGSAIAEVLNDNKRSSPEGAKLPDLNGANHKLFIIGTKGRTQVMIRREEEPLHSVLLCDRSASTMGISCSLEDAVRAFGQWFSDSQLVPGSSFTIWVPGSSRDTASRAFRVAIPEGPLGERAAFVLSAGQELRQWQTEESGSAIAEALNLAVTELNQRPGRRELLILSDLRQYTPTPCCSRWNFEAYIPQYPQWFISWMHTQRLMVRADNISLRICGTHHHRGFTGRDADRLVRVWQAVFQEMGWENALVPELCFED